MEMEKQKEFIGGGEPYEKLELEIKELAEKAVDIEKKIFEARKENRAKEAEELRGEHNRLMEEQREKLKKVAEIREFSLKE